MSEGGSIPPSPPSFKGSSDKHKRPNRSGVGFRNGNFWTDCLPLNNSHYAGFVHSTTKLHAHLVSDAERRVHVESNSPSVRRVGLRLKVSQTGYNVCLGARLPKSTCKPLASISSLGGWRNWKAHLLYKKCRWKAQCFSIWMRATGNRKHSHFGIG